MPYQIKNGIVYGSNAVSLTQAQYDALSTAEKNNGTVYYIYDSEAVLDASDVSLGSGTVEDLAGSVAVIETSPTTATHAVGSYLVYNGQLYEVTAAIAVGETLTVGTNISATTAGAELTSLNNDLSKIYEFVEVLPWGTYGTVGQTATLKRDITKAKMAMFEVGWNSPPNKSGLNCSLIPQMMLAVGSTITIPYVVGGVFSYVIVNIASATSITIADSNNTNLGLRAIVGVF